MTNEPKHDDLERSIDSILSRGGFASTGDEDLDALARIAWGLRGLPNPDFRARLRNQLLPKGGRRAWWPFLRRSRGTEEGSLGRTQESSGGLIVAVTSLRVQPWLRRNRPFAAAGGSCGLLAGTCCLSGAAANVLGVASAAAVSAFIQNTLPYFVAFSIAALVAWLVVRVLREQGLTPKSLALAVRRHGIAMGSAYGAVFGASMGLATAMGLY